jgi:hypothetical protein
LKKTILILLTLLLTLSISTVALAEEPIITPEFEQKIILSAVENVPADLTLILTLNSEIVGVVQDGQVVNAVPILKQFKQSIKLQIQGEGRLVGARMIFTEYIEEPELPILPICELPKEELKEEPEIVEPELVVEDPIEEVIEPIKDEDNKITYPEEVTEEEAIEQEPEITEPIEPVEDSNASEENSEPVENNNAEEVSAPADTTGTASAEEAVGGEEAT